MPTFGENMRRIRDAKGLKNKDLAERMGVAPSAISEWESGTAIPILETVFRIAKALDTSIEALLEGVDVDYSQQRRAKMDDFIEAIRQTAAATTQAMVDLSARGDHAGAIELGEEMAGKIKLAVETATGALKQAPGDQPSREALRVARRYDMSNSTQRALVKLALKLENHDEPAATPERDEGPLAPPSGTPASGDDKRTSKRRRRK